MALCRGFVQLILTTDLILFAGEVPKDYKTFSALQSNASPPASTTPPRPSLPPPPPPAPHNTPIAVHPSKANHHVNGVGGSPVGKMPPGSPPYSASYHPDGSYLAARLTAPASAAASNGPVAASPDSSAFIKVKNVPLTLSAPLPSTPPMPVSLPSSYAPTSSSNSSSPSSSACGVGSSNGGNISPQELKR